MEMTIDSATKRKSNFLPMAIIAGLYFMLGFVTWLNGSLMPYLELVLKLTPVQASLIIFSFYIAVTVFSVPSAWVIKKVGYKNGMAIGILVMAVAAFGFIPAAKTQMFALFLTAQFAMGAGQTLLQTAINPYVVKMGAEESAAARISLMGILNKSAGAIAPMIFAALILTGMRDYSSVSPTQAEIDTLVNNLIGPYIGLGVLVGLLALAVRFSPLPELQLEEESAPGTDDTSIFRFPQLILGVVALFLYVGMEVIAGDTIGSYGRSLGYSEFATLTSFTMTFMVIGYVLGIVLIPRVISQQKALLVSAILGVVLSLGVVFGDTEASTFSAITSLFGFPELPNSIFYLGLLGFANAIVWPAIWPMALSGLGTATNKGSALLVMAISGGAIMPVLMNLVAELDGVSRQGAHLIMTPCYLFILYYAYKGHKMTSWKKGAAAQTETA